MHTLKPLVLCGLVLTIIGFGRVAALPMWDVVPLMAADDSPSISAGDSSQAIIETLLRGLFSQGLPVGMLGWYFYRTTERTLPEKDAAIRMEREAYQRQASEERAAHALIIDKLVQRMEAKDAIVLRMIQHCSQGRTVTDA